MCRPLPKTKKGVITLCDNPCDDTPTAATIAVTAAGEVSDRVLQRGVRKQVAL
jgi:hypothetical protein